MIEGLDIVIQADEVEKFRSVIELETFDNIFHARMQELLSQLSNFEVKS
jgi:hypothetical protein